MKYIFMTRTVYSALRAIAVSSAFILGVAQASFAASIPLAKNDVAEHYATIAHAVFEDALLTAKELDKKINVLVQSPTRQTLAAAKTAWKAARVPYQQSEVFRFGNANVDEWEGQLNAWPHSKNSMA